MKRILLALVVIGLLLAAAAFAVPPIRERVVLQFITWRSEIYYTFNPPEQDVFVPDSAVAQAVQATLSALASPTPQPTATPDALAVETAEPTLIPSPTPTLEPIPGEYSLAGAKHEYQQWNNCGPATLSVNLNYWGWQGDQRNTAGWIKPNERDKNTSPDELVGYVQAETDLQAIYRVGGTLDVVKRLVHAGFPVIIERGFDGYDGEGWMGHYELVTGYSDRNAKVITQDVLIMPDFPMPYGELQDYWRAFNYTFVVVYPPEREVEVMRILGPLATQEGAYQAALAAADADLQAVSGRELFFAWYNRGSNLLALGEETQAVAAFDQAFAVYADLPEEERPWRMVWYRHEAYPAYFSAGRYNDVIDLATHTLSRSSEPALEESFFWRAQAKLALGDQSGAIADWQSALKWHPGWQPAEQALAQLGASAGN